MVGRFGEEKVTRGEERRLPDGRAVLMQITYKLRDCCGLALTMFTADHGAHLCSLPLSAMNRGSYYSSVGGGADFQRYSLLAALRLFLAGASK